jgi:hypothetical protein
MNEIERLQLQKMIKVNDVEDQTQQIRKLKHSKQLKEDINKFLLLKTKYNSEEIFEKSIVECNFLFTNYTDIYNRIKNDEINIDLLFHFLKVLSDIENGELDQHEGSFIVGKILKEIYIDSALKKAEKIDNIYNNQKEELIEPVNIDWKVWKKINKIK